MIHSSSVVEKNSKIGKNIPIPIISAKEEKKTRVTKKIITLSGNPYKFKFFFQSIVY